MPENISTTSMIQNYFWDFGINAWSEYKTYFGKSVDLYIENEKGLPILIEFDGPYHYIKQNYQVTSEWVPFDKLVDWLCKGHYNLIWIDYKEVLDKNQKWNFNIAQENW